MVEELPSATTVAAAPFAPAQTLLAVQREITPGYDMVIPLAVGVVLAILTICLIVVQVRRISLPLNVIQVTRAVVGSALPDGDVKLTPLSINAIQGWPIWVSSAPVSDRVNRGRWHRHGEGRLRRASPAARNTAARSGMGSHDSIPQRADPRVGSVVIQGQLAQPSQRSAFIGRPSCWPSSCRAAMTPTWCRLYDKAHAG